MGSPEKATEKKRETFIGSNPPTPLSSDGAKSKEWVSSFCRQLIQPTKKKMIFQLKEEEKFFL